MVETTEAITFIDGKVEQLKSDEEPHVRRYESQRFETANPVEAEIGTAAEGVPAFATTTDFVAVAIESEQPTEPMAQMALSQYLQQDDIDAEEGEEITEEQIEDIIEESETEEIVSSAVLMVGEDDSVGAGILEVEGEASIEAALENFEEEHL